MSEPISVAVLFGGQSPEHEISIESAKNVLRALSPERYRVYPVFVPRAGQWCLLDDVAQVYANPPVSTLSAPKGQSVVVLPGHARPFACESPSGELVPLPIEVVFPVLHGEKGEDGTLQGMLALLGLRCVGANTLASAVCMNKDVTKRLLVQAGIPVVPWLTFSRDTRMTASLAAVEAQLGMPLFVKPVDTGSSVGVVKVGSEAELPGAFETAFGVSASVLVEAAVVGREIECAVLGGVPPVASLPCEIKPSPAHGFYSYQAKYLDPEGAVLEAPASLPGPIVAAVQEMACRVFETLNCSGMARVDFFLTADHQLLVNEVNTIPGFTQISMYPRMWAVSGLSNEALVDRLIALAE